MFLRVAGSLARERRSMRTAAEVALCSAAAPSSSDVTGKANRPSRSKRRKGGSDGMPRWLPCAVDRASAYPLTFRGRARLLRFGGEITERASARGARCRHVRDRCSRATDTLVRPVPAVAIGGRAVFVAEETAERPVHARTFSGAARTMRRRATNRGACGRMTGSTMTSHQKCEAPKRRIAPPTLSANRSIRQAATTRIARQPP